MTPTIRKDGTYIPTHNSIQQHQLRKPKPPSLIYFEILMAITLPLLRSRPRSSSRIARTCVSLLSSSNRFRTRVSSPILRVIFPNCCRILQHAIVTLRMRNVVHSDPRSTRVHAVWATYSNRSLTLLRYGCAKRLEESNSTCAKRVVYGSKSRRPKTMHPLIAISRFASLTYSCQCASGLVREYG